MPNKSEMYGDFPQLNLPSAHLRVRRCDDRCEVWDEIRQKWVRLTPEEWVRQHFVAMLTGVKGYRRGLIANETAV